VRVISADRKRPDNGSRSRAAVLAFALLAAACGTVPAIQGTDTPRELRCVNMSLVFEYMVRSDPDALGVRNRRCEVMSSIEAVEKKIAAAPDEQARKALSAELAGYRAERDGLRATEEFHKQRILNEINTALQTVAARMQLDYVFDAGNGPVYYKKEYDITENVLREISAQKKRNAPVTR